VKVWDAESGKLEASLKGHTKAVHCLAFDASGAWLASGGADLAVKLWACRDQWACTRTLSGHEHTISGLVWAASGDQIISCSRDQSLKVSPHITGHQPGSHRARGARPS
jgi:platelet-activating factor acetylhydrolase IB subunit alpha